MKRYKSIFLICGIFSLLSVPPVLALNEDTHKDIQKFLGNIDSPIDGFLLDSFMKNQLGLSDGKEELFFKRSVVKWLGKGGREEDKPPWTIPYIRSSNHFHNPLEPDLDEAGFSGVLNLPFFLSGNSSVLWSQWEAGEQWPGGPYSWHDTRDYFFQALTSTDQWTRDKYFALTFMGVGRVMHLIEDVSVPEHARDDGHYADAYEAYVKRMTLAEERPAIYFSKFPPFTFTKSAQAQPSPFQDPRASVPIARLFDSNLYTGANPAITMQADIGLSEYTNANFVSGQTRVKDGTFHPFNDTQFPYPSLHSVMVEDREIPDNFSPNDTVKRPYYVKTDDGDTGYLLAGVSYFDYYDQLAGVEEQVEHIPPMDDNVFKDYADRLMPRAIGYAATLMEYFFRGRLEVTDADLEITNTDDHPNFGYDRVTVHARNVTWENEGIDSEEMPAGRLHLVVRYEVDKNDPYLYIPALSKIQYRYITREYETDTVVPRDVPAEFVFDLSDDPIPLCATNIELFLVYRGRIGAEADGIGVGRLGITETGDFTPTPIGRALTVELPDSGLYSMTDVDINTIDPTVEGFGTISLKLTNNDPQSRNMNGGTVMLVAKYRRGDRDQFQDLPPNPPDEFHYSVSDPVNITLGYGESRDLTFTLVNPIPLWATDVYLYPVYNGVMGTTTDETVAIGFKDISEPTPLMFYNRMDKICIYGTTYYAGSDAAVNLAASEGMSRYWDVYAHARENIYINFSPENDPQYVSLDNYDYLIPNQDPGSYNILYLLADYHTGISYNQGEIINVDSRDDFFGSDYVFSPIILSIVKNQVVLMPDDHPKYDKNFNKLLRDIPVYYNQWGIEGVWFTFSITNNPLPEGDPSNENCDM
ncbi:MAG TPA: hypothetical protein ENJ30_02615 [Desulfobulbaceae bacterium]|nr:hypothetical protein [Desulfobulbaceae bacterium]